jgi:plasmid stabilization system protein ParE
MQKYKIILMDVAEDDLHSIYSYIARDSEYYAEKVKDSIIQWCEDVLSIAPHIGHILHEGKMIREITETTYGYVIRFQIIENTVYILMIYKWQLR